MMKKFEEGAIVLIYVALITVVATLLLVAGNSRVLLGLKRNQASADNIISIYKAESEINDFIARLAGGYIDPADFPLSQMFELGGTEVELLAEGDDFDQTITVTAKRDFSVNVLQAKRHVEVSGEIENVDIILGLDCTGSMNDRACINCRNTRLDAQTTATIDFVRAIAERDDAERYRLGILVFGVDAKWLDAGGVAVTPANDFTYEKIRTALEDNFGSTRESSSACRAVMDGTSVGSAFDMAHTYFASHQAADTKQVEVVITDGEPNSRIPQSQCAPDVFCSTRPEYCDSNPYGWSCIDNYGGCIPYGKDFLRCALADSSTLVPELGYRGIRDPNVDAYAVTVYDDPPEDVVEIFQNYATEGGYYNAIEATQLSAILGDVLNDIVQSTSTVTIRRIIPFSEDDVR